MPACFARNALWQLKPENPPAFRGVLHVFIVSKQPITTKGIAKCKTQKEASKIKYILFSRDVGNYASSISFTCYALPLLQYVPSE